MAARCGRQHRLQHGDAPHGRATALGPSCTRLDDGRLRRRPRAFARRLPVALDRCACGEPAPRRQAATCLPAGTGRSGTERQRRSRADEVDAVASCSRCSSPRTRSLSSGALALTNAIFPRRRRSRHRGPRAAARAAAQRASTSALIGRRRSAGSLAGPDGGRARGTLVESIGLEVWRCALDAPIGHLVRASSRRRARSSIPCARGARSEPAALADVSRSASRVPLLDARAGGDRGAIDARASIAPKLAIRRRQPGEDLTVPTSLGSTACAWTPVNRACHRRSLARSSCLGLLVCRARRSASRRSRAPCLTTTAGRSRYPRGRTRQEAGEGPTAEAGSSVPDRVAEARRQGRSCSSTSSACSRRATPGDGRAGARRADRRRRSRGPVPARALRPERDEARAQAHARGPASTTTSAGAHAPPGEGLREQLAAARARSRCGARRRSPTPRSRHAAEAAWTRVRSRATKADAEERYAAALCARLARARSSGSTAL